MLWWTWTNKSGFSVLLLHFITEADSINVTTLWIGISSWTTLESGFPLINVVSLSCNLSFCIIPSVLGKTSTTFTSFHSFRGALLSFKMTMFPACEFRDGLCHFCRCCRFSRYSHFHLSQNYLARYCSPFHLFHRYKSSLQNWPGGGRRMDVFIVSMWFGVSGSGPVG